MSDVKQIFSLGARQYELVIVDGPICRGNRVFPAQFDHELGVLKVSATVPVDQRAWVVAVAVSDACFRQWQPIPVIWPRWLPGRQDGPSPPPRGLADDPPDR